MASTPRNDEEPTDAPSEVDSQMPPGVVFLLNGLELVEIADSHALEPEFEYDAPHDPFDDLLATYGMPVNIILESPINRLADCKLCMSTLEAQMAITKSKVMPKFQSDRKDFSKCGLSELHQSGGVLQQGTEAVAWHENCGIPSLVEGLPANSRKIGVLSGKGRGTDLDTYILAAPSDQTLVFVVGEFANEGIENYIDEYVEVSGYSLALLLFVWVIYAVRWGKNGIFVESVF